MTAYADFVRERVPYRQLREIERQMGYKPGGLMNQLEGKSVPRLADLDKLADVLGLSPEDAQEMRILALEAAGLPSLAEELRHLRQMVIKLAKRVDQLSKRVESR